MAGSFGIRLQGHEVLSEIRSSARIRTYVVRPQLHDDVPSYMAKEEACYVLRCVTISEFDILSRHSPLALPHRSGSKV